VLGVPAALSICVERPLLECQNIPVVGLEGSLLGRINRDEGDDLFYIH